MSTPREAKELELADEQVAQKRYSQILEAKARRPILVQGPRNTFYTGTGKPAPRVMPTGQLVGRVALAISDPDLGGGSDFYIGDPGRADIDGVDVFSWTAPVACTFYQGTRHHEWCGEVTVTRAFAHRNGQIIDFVDDVLRADAPATPFRKRGLSIPPPPSRSRSRPFPKPTVKPAAVPESRAQTPVAARSDGSTHHVEETSRHPAPTPKSPAGRKIESVPPVRAEELLRTQLQAPRTKSLAPVLATLQPDQYELVTVPAMQSMIIEGQPGTGKTIVASHRAAYLINEETPPENTLDGNILLTGPTIGYTNHVRDVVNRLTDGTDRIKILALPQLMQRILGLKYEPRGTSSRSWQDVDWKLGTLARSAIRRLKASKVVTPTTEQAYEHLRQNGVPGRPITTDPEWGRYLDRLPPYRDALPLRAHAALLALIAWEVAKPTDLGFIEHIIVDEAQDVTPLEWFLLGAINEAHAWTLLGDLNQRRSDHTLSSWQQIREVLGLSEEDAPITTLRRGYRSTKPILEYANRLLPRNQRDLVAFQEEGPQPYIDRVRPGDLGTALIGQVDRLLGAHPDGTVAVISADPATARKSLRTAGSAMARTNPQIWERNGRNVTVIDPDEARGIEFDAVIVVEPADFPQNYGRQGPLYTTLTRPNRELAIVHTKPLPDALRRR
jgi:DNA helicase II / ATP-dependent DNA helicase PcrA